jgi:hypothetical protein
MGDKRVGPENQHYILSAVGEKCHSDIYKMLQEFMESKQ